jgi:hypothetical protein
MSGTHNARSLRPMPDSCATFDSVASTARAAIADLLKRLLTGGTYRDGADIAVGPTPPALIEAGCPERPVVVSEFVIDKAFWDHHVPRDQLTHIPELIREPAMVFDSDTTPGTFVIVTDQAFSGKPLMVFVHPNGKSGRAEVHRIASVYGKDKQKILDWMKAGHLRFIDKKKSLAVATTLLLCMPGVVQLRRGGQIISLKLDSSNDVWADLEEAAADSAYGRNARSEPTVAQQDAGNYKVGRATVQGIPVSIEQPRGSYRSGVNKRGQEWRTRLAAHYGYITGTTGADGDAIDCFIGPWPEADHVFVINQVSPDGTFDEHKCVLGAVDEEHARRLYLDSYARNWRGLGGVVPMTMNQFRWWLRNGNSRRAVEIGHLPHTGAYAMKRVVWDGVTPMHYGEGDAALARIMYEIRQSDADGALLEVPTLDDIEADYDDVYLGYSKEAIAATADLLRYFRDFIDSSFEKAKIPEGLEGFAIGSVGQSDTMTKEQAKDLLHRLVDVAINRKVGDYGMNPRQEKRLEDFRWDAHVIDDYMNKRIRHTGARNMLRTPEMKKKYPEIDNQPASLDSTCFDSVTYDALVVEARRLDRVSYVVQRVLNHAGGELKVASYEVSKPRMFRGSANVTVTFKLSDGQALTVYFHNPAGKPRTLKPTDELISWKWVLNKKDVTIVVAPERGKDLDVAMVARRVMSLANKNSEAFAKSQSKAKATDDKIAGLKVEIEGKETQLTSLLGQIADAESEVAYREEQELAPVPAPVPPAAAATVEPPPAAVAAAEAAGPADAAPPGMIPPVVAEAAAAEPPAAVEPAPLVAVVPVPEEDTSSDSLVDLAVAAAQNGADGIAKILTSDYFTFNVDGDEAILTDELRAQVEAALGKKLVEKVFPGFEGQVNLVPEEAAPAAAQPAAVEKEPATKLDAGNAMSRLGNHLGMSQRKAVGAAMRGEERQYFYDKMVELDETVRNMPVTYSQDGKGDAAVAYLHYFTGSSDWYITERDKGDPDDSPEQANSQAFGFAVLNGDTENAELGYINIGELTRHGAELDFHWSPKTLGEIKKGLMHEDEPAPADASAAAMTPQPVAAAVPPAATAAQGDYVAEVLQAPTARDTDLAYINDVANGRIDLSAPDIADRLEAAAARNAGDAEIEAALEKAANVYEEFMVAAAQQSLAAKA